MTKVMLFGDPHGRTNINRGIRRAEVAGIEHVIFLGDCWDVDVDYGTDINVHYIAGNHEDDTKLKNAKYNMHDDYSAFEIDGVKFGVIGRIDGTSHLAVQRFDPYLHKAIYRSAQQHIEFEKQSYYAPFNGIDVLLTHDAPFPMKLGSEVVGSQFLSDVIKRYKPTLAFHGHMHSYDVRSIYGATVIGLDQMGPLNENSFFVIDTDNFMGDE